MGAPGFLAAMPRGPMVQATSASPARQELDRLRVALVPLGHQRPEPVHALPRPLDVDRVELVHRHAVGEQRDLELRRDAAPEVERPPALELLAVPDLRPRLRVCFPVGNVFVL